MRTCENLIIGSGYAALGMACSLPDALICEESESCDTRFYLTLRSFRTAPYTPVTREGKALREAFGELLGADMQDVCGFEPVFCRFALDRRIPILLKTRVLRCCPRPDGWQQVTLLNNAGCETVLTKRVIDTRVAGDACFTVLFTPAALSRVAALFPEGTVEPAFREDRGALHIPLPADADYNRALEEVCRRWEAGNTGAKLLAFAPRFARSGRYDDGVPRDESYVNPVAAFEAGLAYGKEAAAWN